MSVVSSAAQAAPYFVAYPASSIASGALVPYQPPSWPETRSRAELGPGPAVGLVPVATELYHAGKRLYKGIQKRFSKAATNTNHPKGSTTSSKMGQGGKGGTMKTGKSTSVANVSQNVRLRNTGPRTNTANGVTRIQHKEFVTSLTSSGSSNFYSVQGFAINPGLYSVFPWLANIATSYDEYKFLNIWFEVIPVQPTSATGKFGLALDRNSQDPLPSTRQEFYSTIKSTEGSVWERLRLSVPIDNKFRFVDTGTTVDFKLVDMGQIEFFSDQLTNANTPLGELIVHYDVLLRGPQTPVFGTLEATEVGGVVTTVGPPIATVTYSSGLSATVTFTTTGTFAVNFVYVNSTFSGTLLLGGTAQQDPANTFVSTSVSTVLGITVVQAVPGQTVVASGVTGLSTSGGNRVIVSRVTNRIF